MRSNYPGPPVCRVSGSSRRQLGQKRAGNGRNNGFRSIKGQSMTKEKRMKKLILYCGPILLSFLVVSAGWCAYHHEGEKDADKFLSVYPAKTGTKLDHCALCHSGGQYESKGKMVSLGSCQWCHYSYGYDGAGDIADTTNQYGKDYKAAGRNTDAITAIQDLDSDGDGFSNAVEISADRFPGNSNDDPSKAPAPFRIYTRDQLEAMSQHTQFLLMNTSRSGDFYAEYTGVPMEDLLANAGILPTATGLTVFSPDGWSQYHPLEEEEDPELYHVNGVYPAASYYYDAQADIAENPVDGWCDYSAPSCKGRNNGDQIVNPDGGLKMILALKREGAYMDPGILDDSNKLDGEGPYRVVPPQKNPNAPDQSSKSENQSVIWPYEQDWDHNAGAATRTVTIIKVEPLPEGTTDIDVLEAGWNYVDQEKLVVYGAIDEHDFDKNGILDSEEKGEDPNTDFDQDGKYDWQDADTAKFRCADGGKEMVLHAASGGASVSLTDVKSLSNDDPAVPQSGKPDMTFPFGTVSFEVKDVPVGGDAVITLEFPDNVPTTAKYYKVTTAGWQEIPFGSNDGDRIITLTLTDGDSKTDADGGNKDGTILDPGALAVPAGSSAVGGSGGGSGCFIASAGHGAPLMFFALLAALTGCACPYLFRRSRERK
jgi:hypothetical protein